MATETQKFKITPEQWERANAEASKSGILLPGKMGIVKKSGFEVSYLYVPETGFLEVTLIKKPWIVPIGMVRSKVAEMLAKEGIQPL